MKQIRRGNGRSSGMDAPFSGDSVSDLERIFNQSEMPSVIKEFVHAGKDPQSLMMRTVFRDENERNAFLTLLKQCEEFNLEEHIEMLTNWLAASVSVKGRARKEVLQATAGVVVPGLYADTRPERYRNDKRNGDQEH